MRTGVAVVLSVVVHGLVLFGMAKLMEGVHVGAVREERISLAYVRVSRGERKEVEREKKVDRRAEREVERIKHEKRTERVERKVEEVKEEEVKEKIKEEKVEEEKEVVKEEVAERTVERQEEKDTVAESRTEEEGDVEEVSEAVEEVSGEEAVEEMVAEGEISDEGEVTEFDEEYGEADYQLEYEEANLGLIREMVMAHLRYPLIARRMGWEGTVIIKFRLYPDGAIRDMRVERSSGFELLDKNTVKVIASLSSRFPRPRKPVVVVIPVTYRLE